MHVTFQGAAREVTGSCHLLHVGEHVVALDCGMFQGHRAESEEKNRQLPIPVERLSAVILSHAHIDHSGRLPFLMRNGYSGTIWATPATRDLCAVMLADSAHIQAQDAKHLQRHHHAAAEPLYDQQDVDRTLGAMSSVPYGRTFDVVPGVRATYIDAGHILGSAMVVLDCTEGNVHKRLVFSGDIGRYGLPIIRDPQVPEGVDRILMESTYGDRDHEPVVDMREQLAAVITRTAARGGRVLIPAFAVGRTQELIYDLHALAQEDKIPRIPIYVDSPLAIDTTAVFTMHRDLFDQDEPMVRNIERLFQFDLVHYTRDVRESMALNTQHGPMVVIAASGMAESGRILHHLAHGASDPRNTILIVGFQAEHTLGRRIVERQPLLKVYNEEVPLRAEVRVLSGYSAHADRRELKRWLDGTMARARTRAPVWLVHGEPTAQDAFAGLLHGEGHQVETPSRGQSLAL
jgi:metallo-beta-lactamase family protein